MSLLRRWHEPGEAPGYYRESFDVTGQVSLLPVAAEMRAREASRTARAARRRGSWLRKAASRLGNILRRADRAPERPPGPKEYYSLGKSAGPGSCPFGPSDPNLAPTAVPARRCDACGVAVAPDEPLACMACLILPGDTNDALSIARAAAERDGRIELRDAIHHLIVLDAAGMIPDVLPLLARPSLEITRALQSGKDAN